MHRDFIFNEGCCICFGFTIYILIIGIFILLKNNKDSQRYISGIVIIICSSIIIIIHLFYWYKKYKKYREEDNIPTYIDAENESIKDEEDNVSIVSEVSIDFELI
jgi:hypothetical protein